MQRDPSPTSVGRTEPPSGHGRRLLLDPATALTTQFMEGMDSVRQIDEKHLHWKGEIAGVTREWDAEIDEWITLRLPDQAKLPSGRRTSSSSAQAGSQNRTARCYLHACHAARVERDQPVAVAAAEDPGLLAQHLDDLLNHLILIVLVGI